jgi:hypothetical protein
MTRNLLPKTRWTVTRTPGLAPSPAAHPASCAQLRRELQRLKDELHAAYAAGRPGTAHALRLVLNEAEALAWQTPFPHLFFPVLAEEKAAALVAWQERQAAVRPRAREISFAA